MKKMTKLLALAMALLLVLSISACKKEAAASTAAPTEAAAPEATEGTADPTETTAPAESVPAAPVEGETQPAAPADPQLSTEESEFDFDLEISMEEELLWEDEIGTGPMITVTWETYDAMPDSEKEAYRACFTNQAAFDSWEELALMDYESQFFDEGMMGMGSLILKDIISMLIGQEL